MSPAGNIVGFEHEAVTATERIAIQDAIEQLKDGSALFDLPPAAGCSLMVADVKHGHQGEEHPADGHGLGAKHYDHAKREHTDATGEDGHVHDAKHADGDEHDHAMMGHQDDPGHDAEHEHAEADHQDGPGRDAEHDEHGPDGEEANDTHSEFYAHYHYECDGSSIGKIGLRLFEHWPRIEQIRVQALTPTGQFGGNTKANDPVIKLK